MKIAVPAPVLTASLTLLASVGFGGCTVGAAYHPPVTPTPPAYQEAPASYSASPGAPASPQGWQPAQPQDAKLRGAWWQIFNDTELNGLEDRLNISNQNIQVAFANFQASRELVRQASAAFYPTVTGSAAITGSHSSSAGNGSGGGGGGSPAFSLPFDVSWEPDLWGRVRNQVHAQQYAAQLSAADLENEKLTEQAALAVYFFELRGQDAAQAMYAATVTADRKALAIAQASYQTGIGDQLALVESESTLHSAQAAATGAAILRAQYQHAIAMLVGQIASTFSLPVRALQGSAPPIPLGLPSQLLQRRPDIAAAERAMAQANAIIGVAESAYYPSLTLAASGGFESSSLAQWLTWPSRFWSIGPSLAATIFDAGLRRATVRQDVELFNSAAAAYRQTVLTAFQQVEDYLAAIRLTTDQIQLQQQAVNSAQTFLNLELGRYETGLDPYVDVLTAQTTLFTAQQSLVSLRTQVMISAVELVEALGGGWDSSQLPTPAAVSHR